MELVGISGTVVAFVVLGYNDLCLGEEKIMLGENLNSLIDMILNAFPFGPRQWASFIEDVPGYSAFPDIVEKKNR